YTKNRGIFQCRTHPGSGQNSVTYNWNQWYGPDTLARFSNVSAIVLISDRWESEWCEFDTSKGNGTSGTPICTTHGATQNGPRGCYPYFPNGAAEQWKTRIVHRKTGANYVFADGHAKYFDYTNPAVTPEAFRRESACLP